MRDILYTQLSMIKRHESLGVKNDALFFYNWACCSDFFSVVVIFESEVFNKAWRLNIRATGWWKLLADRWYPQRWLESLSWRSTFLATVDSYVYIDFVPIPEYTLSSFGARHTFWRNICTMCWSDMHNIIRQTAGGVFFLRMNLLKSSKLVQYDVV